MDMKWIEKNYVWIGLIIVSLFLISPYLSTLSLATSGTFEIEDYWLREGRGIDVEGELDDMFPNSNTQLTDPDDWEGMEFNIKEINTFDSYFQIVVDTNKGSTSLEERSYIVQKSASSDEFQIYNGKGGRAYIRLISWTYDSYPTTDVSVLHLVLRIKNTDVEPYEECSSDSDCEVDEFCDDHECKTADCFYDDDCSYDEECNDNECERLNCASGYDIINHQCVLGSTPSYCGDGYCDYDETITSCPDDCGGSTPPECYYDGDCSYDEECNYGECVLVEPSDPECSSDSDCEVDEICVGYECEPMSSDDQPNILMYGLIGLGVLGALFFIALKKKWI